VSVSTVPPGREAPVVLVVAKAPVAGGSKTRLGSAIGADQAAALARAMLLDTLDGCRAEAGIVGVLCANREEVDLLVELAGPGTPIVVQDGRGLSDALRTGVRYALEVGDVALLVSSDIPGIPEGALHRTVQLLRDGADVVLGPGYDGGYWLIAVREHHPRLFDDIPWSTEGVLDATLARCRELSLNPHVLDPWRDIDTAADLRSLAEEVERLPGRRTAAAVARLNLAKSDTNPRPAPEHAPTIEEVRAR